MKPLAVQTILMLSILNYSFSIPIEKSKSHHRLKRHNSKRENLVFFNQPIELDEDELLQGTANYVRSDDLHQSYDMRKQISPISETERYNLYAHTQNETIGASNNVYNNVSTNNFGQETRSYRPTEPQLETGKPQPSELEDDIYGKLKSSIANSSLNINPIWSNANARYYNDMSQNNSIERLGDLYVNHYGDTTTSPPTFNPFLPQVEKNVASNDSSKTFVTVSEHESVTHSSDTAGKISNDELNIHHQTENTVHSGNDFEIHIVNPDPQINEQLNEVNNVDQNLQQTNESFPNSASASASMNAVMNFQYQSLETQSQIASEAEDTGYRVLSSSSPISYSNPNSTLSPWAAIPFNSSSAQEQFSPLQEQSTSPVPQTLSPQTTVPPVQSTSHIAEELTTTLSPYDQWLANISLIYKQYFSNISSTTTSATTTSTTEAFTTPTTTAAPTTPTTTAAPTTATTILPPFVEVSKGYENSFVAETPKNAPISPVVFQQNEDQKSVPNYPQRAVNTVNVIASGPVILNIQQPPLVVNISQVESLSTNIFSQASQENITATKDVSHINDASIRNESNPVFMQQFPLLNEKAVPTSSNTTLYGATMQQSMVAEISQKDIPIDSEESKNILSGSIKPNSIAFKPEQTESYNALKQQNIYLGENNKINNNGGIETTIVGLYNQRNKELLVGPANESMPSTLPNTNAIPKQLDEGTYHILGQPTVLPFTPVIPKQVETFVASSIQRPSLNSLDSVKGNSVISPKKVAVEGAPSGDQQIHIKPALPQQPYFNPNLQSNNNNKPNVSGSGQNEIGTNIILDSSTDKATSKLIISSNPVETLSITTTQSPGVVINSNKVEVSFDRLHFPSSYPDVYRVQFKVPMQNETNAQAPKEKLSKSFAVLDNEAAYELMKPQRNENAHGAITSTTVAPEHDGATKNSLSCFRDRKIASDPNSFDMFKPDCLSNGDYKPIQCYEHSKFGKWCWCVDISGQEIIGSKVDAHSGNLTNEKCMQFRNQNSTNKYWTTFYRPTTTATPLHVFDAIANQTKQKEIGQCEKERQLSKAPMIGGDSFSPECNQDGSYKSRQCFTHLYYGKQCWCVDKFGQELLGTRRIDGSHPDCKKVSKELCTYQAKKGKCNMHITKIFFNLQTKECEFFVYSGCGGNANNFMSVVECETKCKKESLVLVEIQPEKAQPNLILNTTHRNENQIPHIENKNANEILTKISFAVVQPFSDSVNSPLNPTYIQIKSALNQTIYALYPILFKNAEIAYMEPYIIPNDLKRVQYILMHAVLTFTEVPNDDFQLIQDTVNSGVFGGLLVIIGSYRRSPAQEAISKVGYAYDGLDCKYERFGCCADGNSPAEGPNREGCPEEKCPCKEIDAEFCILIPFDKKLKKKNSFQYKQLNNDIHKWMALNVYIGVREYERVEIVSLSEREQLSLSTVNLTEVVLKIHFSGPVSDPITPLRKSVDKSSDIIPTMKGSLVCDKGQPLTKKLDEKKLIGVIGGNNDSITVIKDDRAFAMFKSPETAMEESILHEVGESEPSDISTTKKKMTLMIARPLRYYQMGKYFPHLDAGNPALIIPDKDGASFHTKKIYKPFESRYNKDLIPIYNKDGKEIAAVAYDNELKNYQVDNHNKREKIFHRTDPSNLDTFRPFLAVHLSFDQFEGDKIIDVSGNNNNGLISGAATIMHTNYSCGFACRLIGGDVTFDGSKLVPKPGSAVTIAVWVKVNNTNTQQVIFSTVGFSHNEQQYDFRLNYGKIKWSHIDETRHTVFNVETRENYVNPDQWMHIAGTYDSAARKAQIFVNARLITTVDGSGLLSEDWGKSAKIGSKVDGQQLNGFVDEFYILTRALSEKEIGELVNACSYALPSPEYGLDFPCKECIVPLSQSTSIVKPQVSTSITEVFPSVKCTLSCTNSIISATISSPVVNTIPLTSSTHGIYSTTSTMSATMSSSVINTSPVTSFTQGIYPTTSTASFISSTLVLSSLPPAVQSTYNLYSSTIQNTATTLLSKSVSTFSSTKTDVFSSMFVTPTPSSSNVITSTQPPPPTTPTPTTSPTKEPSTPIRSCREYYDRCHRRHDGIYRLANALPNEESDTYFTYCDMNRNQGGWTLVITSQSADWDLKNILYRGNDNPGLQSDFSILNRSDGILSIANNSFQYRLEAGDLGQFGGIWEAPAGYKVLNYYNNQTDIKLVKKFSQWNYTSSIRFRMPYIPLKSSKALLTTAENPEEDWFGTIVAKDAAYTPAPWLETVAANPLTIWYWIREAKGLSDINSENSSSQINIFYYNVEVVNNISASIVLEWTLGSDRKFQVLDGSSVTRMVNELRTTVPSPPGVSFKVSRLDRAQPIFINNAEELEVTPAVAREEFTLLEITSVPLKDLKAEELKTFYFNYQFVNHAEGKVDITFEEFGRPEKVTLDADDVLNWLRIFRSREKPNFVLKATKKSNGNPLKINGQENYTMLSTSSRNSIIVVDISLTGKDVLREPLFYSININIQNDAGKRVTLTWRDGIKEIDIDENSKAEFHHNLTSYVSTLPQYKVMMVQYGTNISESVNNQQVIDLVPTKDGLIPITYVVTSSGLSESMTESLREDPVCPPAIDGDYGEWGEWTACSASCGTGQRYRNRTCNSPVPENGGRSCTDQGLGFPQESAYCITFKCPENIPTSCQLHVVVINLSDNIAQIKAMQGTTEVVNKEIFPNRHVENTASVTISNGKCPQSFIYIASDSNSDVQYYINGQESYSVPWKEDYIYNVLYIAKRKGEYSGDSKIYFINLRFISTVLVPVNIIYNGFEYAKQKVIQPQSITTVNMLVNTTVRPSFVMSAVYDLKKYFLNGNYELNYFASDIKGEITEIRITEDDIVAPPSKQYFVNVEIINTVPANIIVIIDKEPIELFYQDVVLRRGIINSVFQPFPVVYTAYLKSNSSVSLFLNNQLQLMYKLSTVDSTYRIFVAANQEMLEPKVYYLNLQFINKYESSIATLSWIVNGKSLVEDVAPGSVSFVNYAFISESTPLPSNITGFIKGTSNKVLLNRQAFLPVLASQQQNIVSITIGEGTPIEDQQVIFYTILQVINYDQSDVVIKYNFSGVEQQVFIPSLNSKIISEFQVASSQPDNVTFRAFKTNGISVPMNNLELYVAKPTASWNVATVIIGSRTQYNVVVNITNYNTEGNPVLIKYTINGITETAQLDPRNSIKLAISEFSNKPIMFSAEDILTKAPVTFNNGKNNVEVVPYTENQYEYISIGSPSKQEYNLHVYINNYESLVAEVSYEVMNNKFGVVVGPSSLNIPVIINSKNNNPVRFTGINQVTGQSLMLNQKPFVEFTPSLDTQPFKIINIGSQMQTYYVSMVISNYRSDSIEVKFQYFNETEGTKQLASKEQISIDYMATLPTQPADIYVYAVKAGTESIVFLSNKSETSITPTTDRVPVYLITGSAENELQVYYMDVLLINSGEEEFTFMYPPVLGKVNVIRPYSSFSYYENKSSESQPEAISVTFQKSGDPTASRTIQFQYLNKLEKQIIYLNEASPTITPKNQSAFYFQYLMDNPLRLNLTITFKQAGNIVRVTQFKELKYGDAITNLDVPTSTPVTVTAVNEGESSQVLINGQPYVVLFSSTTPTTEPPPLTFSILSNINNISETYGMKLALINIAGENDLQVIFKQDGVVIKTIDLGKYQVIDESIVKSFTTLPLPVTVTALNKGSNLPALINGKSEVVIRYTKQPFEFFSLNFAESAKTYGIDYTLTNTPGENDFQVIFKQDGVVIKTIDLLKNQVMQEIIQKSFTTLPLPVTVTALKKGSNLPALINGKSEVVVQFTEYPYEKFVLNFAESAKTYGIDYTLTNTPGENDFQVVFKQDGVVIKTIDLLKNQVMQEIIQKSFTTLPLPVTVTALKKGSNLPALINGQSEVVVQFTEYPYEKFVLNFAGSAKTYGIDYTLTNTPGENDFQVVFKQDGVVIKTIDLLKNQVMQEIIQKSFTTLPLPVTVTALKKGSNLPALINGKSEVVVRFTEYPYEQFLLNFAGSGTPTTSDGSVINLGGSTSEPLGGLVTNVGGSTSLSSGGSVINLGNSTSVLSGGSTINLGGINDGSLGSSMTNSSTGGSSGGLVMNQKGVPSNGLSAGSTGGSSDGSVINLGGSTSVLSGGPVTNVGGSTSLSSGGSVINLGNSTSVSSGGLILNEGSASSVLSGGSTINLGGINGGSLGSSMTNSSTGGSSGGLVMNQKGVPSNGLSAGSNSGSSVGSVMNLGVPSSGLSAGPVTNVGSSTSGSSDGSIMNLGNGLSAGSNGGSSSGSVMNLGVPSSGLSAGSNGGSSGGSMITLGGLNNSTTISIPNGSYPISVPVGPAGFFMDSGSTIPYSNIIDTKTNIQNIKLSVLPHTYAYPPSNLDTLLGQRPVVTNKYPGMTISTSIDQAKLEPLLAEQIKLPNKLSSSSDGFLGNSLITGGSTSGPSGGLTKLDSYSGNSLGGLVTTIDGYSGGSTTTKESSSGGLSTSSASTIGSSSGFLPGSLVSTTGVSSDSSLGGITNKQSDVLNIKPPVVAVIYNNTQTKISDSNNNYDVYYISLQVDNQNSQYDSILKWTLPDAVTNERFIPANSIVFHEFQIGATGIPKPVFFQARVRNTSQAQKLNGLEKLSITPSIIKSTRLVKIEAPSYLPTPKPNPNRGNSSDLVFKMYYVSVHLNNKEKNNIIVKWNELNDEKTVFIPNRGELYQEFVIRSDMDPGKVIFRAYNSETMKAIKINGKDSFVVTPTTRKIVVTANIGNKIGAGKTYYLTFNILNKSKNKINLVWVENGEEKNIEIPRSGTVIYRSQFLSTTVPGLIDISGYTSGNVSRKVLVNGKQIFQLEPRENQDVINIEVANTKSEDKQQTFYMSVRVENNANDGVLLVYKENGFDRERQIPANSVQYAEIMTTSESQPQQVVFKVFTKDRSRQLLLNNQKEVVIKPLVNKVITVLEVGDPALKIYFINLHITNNAGKKVTLKWSENTNQQTQDIESGKAANLSKIIRIADDSLPQYEFQVHEFGTNKNLLINGKESFTLMPSSDSSSFSYIELTPGEPPNGASVTETHLVVLFDNQMDRMIKIIPSRSSRGKYFVEPRAYLQVNITVDSQNPFEEIFFKALDQEKQYSVLLNESLSIPLKPTTNKNFVYNVTITPQALKVIPSHSYAFLEVQDDMVLGNPSFTTHSVSASQLGGLQLNGPKSWMDAQFQSNDCLIKPYLCPDGFTLSLKGGFSNKLNTTESHYVLDSGAYGGSFPGVSMYLKGNKLHYQLTTKDKTWTVDHQVSDEDREIYVIATWKESSGLLFYFNAVLVSADTTGTRITETNENEIRPNFSIGRNIRGESYGYFSISSFTTFNTFIESPDILNVYIFLWSSYAAKGYTCKLRVNMADDRVALLLPDKGKPEGFIIHPDHPLEITLIDLSTDGKTVASVYFTASDLKTGVPLLINNNYKPVECLPVERQLEYINLVITTPAPGANPVFIWVLNEIVKGQIHSNPPLVPSTGGLEEVDGGIKFDGKTGFLYAGEFDGTCFSNPNLCIQGLTIIVQVKLLENTISNNSFSNTNTNFENAPKYIIDSGGHRGQGFSIYVQNGQIYCEVSYNTIMWRVKSNAIYNNLTSILFTWHQDKGLTLYIDGEEKAKTMSPVDIQDRTGEFNNRITIGAENTQSSNTFTSMVAKKIVFFEQYVSRSEAMKIDAFYGVHSVTISADRFININFENNAGADVTLFPDKGERKAVGYSINQKMILELRLVEQGSQTNFPVIFRANNTLTGESLLLDGSITFVGTPTENPNEVFLVNITKQLSCPDSEENGVFPDPGDRYYFISCNQGIAQRKKCPTGTMFNKDKMECIKEKGLKPSTKVSAQVKMQNFAGVPIIVTAKPANESFKKDIDMLPGMRKTWKIDESSMNEPFEFTAKSVDSSSKDLLINGKKSVEVRPQPEENYIVELTVTDPDFFYTATTYTAEGAEAGTAAKIFIKLYGIIGQTNEIQLVGKDANTFTPGETDSFKIDAGNLGRLQKILLRSDDTGPSANWHVDKIIINDTAGNVYRFPANVWLSSEPGKHLEMTFEVGVGAVDITGASTGAQQVNTAKLEVVSLVNHKVDLKVSTSEKPFRLLGYENQELIITTPSSKDVNVTVVDADTGDRYYINNELIHTISLKEGGVVEKITITEKPSAVVEKHANIALGKMLESKNVSRDYERPSYHATVPTISTVVMLWLENTVSETIELVEVRNTINPVIIQSNTTAKFGLSVESHIPLKFYGFLYGNRDEPVLLNRKLEFEVYLQSDFYHLVHIVIERMRPEILNSKHESKAVPKIKAFINIKNELDQVIKVYDITGSIEPIHVQPYQDIEESFTVSNSWPIILKAQSEKQDKVLLNGQDKYTFNLLPGLENFIKICITSLPTSVEKEPTTNVIKNDLNTILLNVNNTLSVPIIVIEAVNHLQPIIVPPKTVCKIGFVINGTEFIILTAVQVETKHKSALLNGYSNLAVQVKMEPTDFEKIDITGDDINVNERQFYRPLNISSIGFNKSLGVEVLKQAEISKIPPVSHGDLKKLETVQYEAQPNFIRNEVNQANLVDQPNSTIFNEHNLNDLDNMNKFLFKLNSTSMVKHRTNSSRTEMYQEILSESVTSENIEALDGFPQNKFLNQQGLTNSIDMPNKTVNVIENYSTYVAEVPVDSLLSENKENLTNTVENTTLNNAMKTTDNEFNEKRNPLNIGKKNYIDLSNISVFDIKKQLLLADIPIVLTDVPINLTANEKNSPLVLHKLSHKFEYVFFNNQTSKSPIENAKNLSPIIPVLPNVIDASKVGDKATSNATSESASLTTQIQFVVINKAGENITILDSSGKWKMSFPTESDDSRPQVAMTFNKDKTLKLTARSSSGEFLYINGEMEYILGPNMQTNGLVIHREGHDWKSDLAFGGGFSKKVSFAALNVAGQDAILKEVSGTNIAMAILNGAILEGGQSMFGRTDPLKYVATTRSGKPLLINNYTDGIILEPKGDNEIVKLVIHDRDTINDWSKYVDREGNLLPPSYPGQMFVSPNMLEEDITLSEITDTGISMDIQKGDMIQFTIPSLYKRNKAYRFVGMRKISRSKILLNGQAEFSVEPSDVSITPIISHKQGQNWNELQSSFLSTVISSPTIPLKLVFSNRRVDNDITISELGGNFKDLQVPKGAIMLTVNLKIPGHIQNLNLSAYSVNPMTTRFMNGQQNLIVNTKSPPPLIVVHKQGEVWQDDTQSQIKYSTSTNIGTAKTFKIHVRNEVDKNIKFRQTTPAEGPVVVVPKDVTAKVDYVDKDHMGILTFEAVGEENGREVNFLLNGKNVLTVNEETLPVEGEFVVIHKLGQPWQNTQLEMRAKEKINMVSINPLGSETGSETTFINTMPSLVVNKPEQSWSKNYDGPIGIEVLTANGGNAGIGTGVMSTNEAVSTFGKDIQSMIDSMNNTVKAISSLEKEIVTVFPNSLVNTTRGVSNLTVTVSIINNAGVEALVYVNGKESLKLPISATGKLTIITPSIIKAVAGISPLQLNNHAELVIINATDVVITRPEGSGNKDVVSPTHYGKLNFKNKSDKDVKIYEVSGIGEPTVLSTNYVSTFFCKVPEDDSLFQSR